MHTCPKCGEECEAVPEGPHEDEPMVSECCGEYLPEASWRDWHQNQLCLKADAAYDEMRDREIDRENDNAD